MRSTFCKHTHIHIRRIKNNNFVSVGYYSIWLNPKDYAQIFHLNEKWNEDEKKITTYRDKCIFETSRFFGTPIALRLSWSNPSKPPNYATRDTRCKTKHQLHCAWLPQLVGCSVAV